MAIKILIGGSPCTYWRIAQTNNRETKAEGMGWELFKNYLIAKEKFKPDFFLYENNKSASQAIKDQIAEELGVGVDPNVRFTYINSSLVSAQNRQRFYVTNFGEIELPEDRGILLKDILESGDIDRDKAHAVISSAGRTTTREYFDKQQGNMALEPVRIPEYGVDDKARPVTASYAYKGSGEGTLVTEAFPNNPNKQVRDYVAEPIRVGSLPRPNGELSTSQAMRVYSTEGKSVNQTSQGGGLGAKTGLYAIPTENAGECAMFATPHGWNEGLITYDKSQTITTGSSARQQNVLIQDAPSGNGVIKGKKPMAFINKVYEVKDGLITIKGKQYPIKLKDGYYIIRKLTVKECARLQTMPDDYCKSVSDSQAYKALGNGWTAEVIIHLLNHALKDIPRDEEIVVLSMYDGIATGRYCLDKMGFTNVTYHAYEIDKYPIQVAMNNYPDIIQHGDAFAVREDDWQPPQTRSEWLDDLLGGEL